MTPEEYALAQGVITAGLASYIQRVAGLFTGQALSLKQWLEFLSFIFPEVRRSYVESATLGRSFYDSQRSIFHPDLGRNDTYVSDINFDWFVKNMEPARRGMSQEDSPKSAVSKLVLASVREVEMGARRQIIRAVNDDQQLVDKLDGFGEQREITVDFSMLDRPSDTVADVKRGIERPESRPEPLSESRPVIGWARVATGRETCAWCLMLISRGAELNHKGNFAYSAANAGGIDLDDETALDLYKEAGGDLDKFRELLYDEEAEESRMEQWHAGCDCLVVPVFDLNNWPGRKAAKEALQLWVDASKEAAKLIESGESRTSNKGTETLNALRRRLYRGEISMSDYAVAA